MMMIEPSFLLIISGETSRAPGAAPLEGVGNGEFFMAWVLSYGRSIVPSYNLFPLRPGGATVPSPKYEVSRGQNTK
jgi:hypothetical protein